MPDPVPEELEDDDPWAEEEDLDEENAEEEDASGEGEDADVYEEVFAGDAKELCDGRRGSAFTDAMRREKIRRWRVVTKTNQVNPDLVCDCPGLPLPWSFFTPPGPVGRHDLKAVLVSLEAEQEHKDDWQCWIVTGRYSSHPSQAKPVRTNLPHRNYGAQNNPDEERPKLKWSCQQMQLAATRDLDGKWYLNSANQPFSPAYMVDVLCPILTIVRNERHVSQRTINTYAYCVNSDNFLGSPPGLAQVFDVSADEFYLGDEVWYRTEIKIRFAPEAQVTPDGDDPLDPDGYTFSWQPRILDAGLCELNTWAGVGPVPPDDGKPIPIIGPGGIPISQPVCLDGEGKRKLPEVGGPNDGKVIPYYLDFRQRYDINFSSILTYGLSYYGGEEIVS